MTTTSRPLRLKETFDELAKSRGQEVARALLIDNPLAAFEGRDLQLESTSTVSRDTPQNIACKNFSRETLSLAAEVHIV